MSFEAQIAAITAKAAQHEAANLQASRLVMDDYCDNTMIPYAKVNAPWQDRPDDQRPKGLPHARELLDYVPDHPAELIEGGKGHLIQGATYGRFLETANGSRFATLQPTVAALGTGLTQRLKEEVWK